jgi:hypothetical protein
MDNKNAKPPAGPASKSGANDLTCSEAQVEDLLSDGESTEREAGEDISFEKGTTPKASPLKTTPVRSPVRQRRKGDILPPHLR